MAVMAELGVVDGRAARPAGVARPAVAATPSSTTWHATHADALLRGRVDPLAVDAWLAEQGAGLADAEGQRRHPGDRRG